MPTRWFRPTRLIELIWGDEAPETADHSLQVYVSELRKALEPKHGTGAPHTLLVSQPSGALYRSGRQAEASDVYQRTRERAPNSLSAA